MTYPTPPNWSEIYERLCTEYHSKMMHSKADKEHQTSCQEWLDGLEDEQVLEFTQDLVKRCGEFRPNSYGLMMPDCNDREFPYRILSVRLHTIGKRKEYANKFKAEGYGILSYENSYAGYVRFHQEQNKWYWELIHESTVVEAGFDDSERWAWEACISAYHLRTYPFPEDDDVQSDAQLEY